MRVAVCIPYFGHDPERANVLEFCLRRWRAWGHEPVIADSPLGLVGARNAAARQAGDWKVAVFADADVTLLERGQLDRACTLAHARRAYVSCYTTLHRMRADTTRATLRDNAPLWDGPFESSTVAWEGCFAISRPLWDELGGFDERFGTHIGQETAMIHAASTLAELLRVPGDAYHLWHPETPHTFSEALWPRYRAATDDPGAMRALLQEARDEREA